MKELVEYMARSLVDEPDHVQVTEKVKDDLVQFQLSVAPKDIGKVIGVKGQVIHSIRHVVQAGYLKDHKKVQIDVVKGGNNLATR
ncbi:KH domain-containing protein [Thermoflavimicrobium daqui]|jgi:predicted RNA-binding protein YlqC (UPF0109 family)|uniref:RNA-binding protein KhpA n=1 Tax=Thermoflavimicrobium daqui TaxID=2137476 RepID=A0A364K7K1_9BACL|nr:KH domain-containing protein [Thermoflavimicrobium daqui]RAL26180.1 RNA-binding protein [Thermoflavimicrobium daqui]